MPEVTRLMCTEPDIDFNMFLVSREKLIEQRKQNRENERSREIKSQTQEEESYDID